ncbi:hypothetical protein [Quatrionicoccus australiensis]|uniref:hypothetical protein n=1 Tax=Quatrionicoccus australiensis TaxID=138118 RepID=UPI001CFC4559|nr:hypothetical protein [Quatrionicoccus australiensis]MCB4358777.1 hypothetical protein [Quatrionicoccus australiensis]
MPSDSRPRCNACEHFHITFDPNFRYGCRALAFKSRRLPERDVIESSGQLCQFFAPKQKRP